MKLLLLLLSCLLMVGVVSAAPFLTTWRTTSPGQSITLDLISGGTYNFVVDWGDGSNSTVTSFADVDKTHSYSSPGYHNVSLSGTVIGWRNEDFSSDIYEIRQWGDVRLISSTPFWSTNLVITATDVLNLSETNSMNGMFFQVNFGSQQAMDAIGLVDTSHIVDMNQLFYNSNFDGDISGWDTGNVVSFGDTFTNSPFNHPIGGWDVSKATDMSFMFSDNTVFNQDISAWNINASDPVLGLNAMFFGSTAFNQDIGSWDVSNVKNYFYMFYGASAFDQNLGLWNVSGATSINFFMTGVNLSVANYDSTLAGWASLPTLVSGRTVDFGDSQYSDNASRAVLTGTYGWTVSDGGWSGLVSCTPDWSCSGYAACDTGDERVCNAVTDANVCGDVYSGDYSEFTPLTCDFCTPAANNNSWTSWSDEGFCLINDSQEQTRNTSDYDVNACYAITGLPADLFSVTTYYDSQFIFCDFCTPDWFCNGHAACDINDEQLCVAVADNNLCGDVYSGDYSEFTPLVCDFCTPDWYCVLYEGCVDPALTEACEGVSDNNTCSEPYSGNYSEFTPLTCSYGGGGGGGGGFPDDEEIVNQTGPPLLSITGAATGDGLTADIRAFYDERISDNYIAWGAIALILLGGIYFWRRK